MYQSKFLNQQLTITFRVWSAKCHYQGGNSYKVSNNKMQLTVTSLATECQVLYIKW